MKIVVADGFTMNPGDLDWEPLRALGTECAIYERTAPEQTVARLQGAEAVITNKVLFDEAVLDRLPALRYIGVSGTGYNVVDVAAATRRGIVVTNVPAYSTPTVAQMTFAHILHLANQVGVHAASVRRGDWSASPHFSYCLTPQVELAGRRLGVYGYGAIGAHVARIAVAFGMRVLAYRRHALPELPPGVVAAATPQELFRESDIVSLHCPLTAENARLIDAAALAHFKPGAWLINTSRGGLLDEAAVADALASGQLGAAGLDVLSQEPPAPDNPLLQAPNCYITPHIAWAARAARQRLFDTVVANLAAYCRQAPQNQVN